MTGLGILPVLPPITGPWSFQGFPPSVQLDGVPFNQAVWVNPIRSGVVAQYRQAVPVNAMHLLVYADGQYVIDHLDQANPDMGLLLEHASLDAPLATTVACALAGLVFGFIVGASFFD